MHYNSLDSRYGTTERRSAFVTSASSSAASKKVLEFFRGEFAQRVRDHLYLLLSAHFRRW